jgi:hypothetical protein
LGKILVYHNKSQMESCTTHFSHTGSSGEVGKIRFFHSW